MSVHTYRTTKSAKQPFVHVHFVINTDHHIVEINDAMAENTRLSHKAIKDAIVNNKFDKYVFQADDEGFYTIDDMNSDIVVSGNVTDYNDDPYSKFIFEIKDVDNVRSLIIRTTFNQRQVTTVIPIGSRTHKRILAKMVHSITSALYSGFSDWYIECIDDMFGYDE